MEEFKSTNKMRRIIIEQSSKDSLQYVMVENLFMSLLPEDYGKHSHLPMLKT